MNRVSHTSVRTGRSLARMGLALCAAAMIVGGTATSASAAFIHEVYNTDFTGELDNTIPTDWSVVTANGTWKIENEEYKHTAVAVGTNIGLSVYEGDVAGNVDAYTLTDYTVRSNIRASGPPLAGGVVARYTDASNFYHLRVNLVAEHLNLQLYSWSTAAGVVVLDTAPISADFRAGELALTVEGSQLTGELYDAEGNLITTVSAIDANNTSGTFGLRNSGAGTTLVAENVAVYTAIPEPASLVLMGMGAMLIFKRPTW